MVGSIWRCWQLGLSLVVGWSLILGLGCVPALAASTPFELGVAHIQAQKFLHAIADFSEALVANPVSSGAYTNRCFAQLQVENYKAAILDCTDAISLGRTEDALINRGIAYYRQADFARAIADFDTVLSHNPQCAEAYLNRGIARSELGNLSAGLEDLDLAARYFWSQVNLDGYYQVKAEIKAIQARFYVIL